MTTKEVTIDYTNWRGERRMRKIRPLTFAHDKNQYHPTPCYMLRAIDLEDGTVKTFAMAGVHQWIEP